MQISTLRKIVKALGGELDVLAKFPKGIVKLEQFIGGPEKPVGASTSGFRIKSLLRLFAMRCNDCTRWGLFANGVWVQVQKKIRNSKSETRNESRIVARDGVG